MIMSKLFEYTSEGDYCGRQSDVSIFHALLHGFYSILTAA